MIQIVLLRGGHVHPKGFPDGLCVPNIEALFNNLGSILERLRQANPDNLKNVYFTVGHHSGLGGPLPVRDKTSYDYQEVLAFDIDSVDIARAWDYLPLVSKVMGVSPSSLIFSSSGNGLHVIGFLKTPIRSNKYLEETKPNYNEICYRINTALIDANLPGKADPAIWDAPRILRLPNSINSSVKKGVKESKLLQWPGKVPLDIDVVKLSGLDKLEGANVDAATLKKNYPRPDFPEIMSQCEFMKWLAANPTLVHEPNFMSAVGLLSAIAPGDKAAFPCPSAEGGVKEMTSREVAEAIFDGATASKSLAPGDFSRKWEHGIRYGAPKCSTISSQWIGGCERCPHYHKINTPLALKSPRHISSEANGYWVMGQKGPLHPHYKDLEKVYSGERPYVSCEPDRILSFDGTHYKPTGSMAVKAWLDKKVGQEADALRDVHCVEFVKKIMRSNTLDEAQEADLFEQTVRGKLNCRNGVIDVIKGDVIAHSSTLGFRYVLPYNYEAGQVSTLFLEWLAQVMKDRTELMDTVLDLMAYCLWPGYDDHVFAYLVGEGRNGKSTLLHLIQALVGRQNYSTVSISQLGSNRFAPASLESKLVNVSEESSGNDLTFEEINVLKDLSAGGEIQAERKGQQPFVLKNTAKLIFSANKTPRFHEQGKAIRARLLAIPFDYTFEKPDPNIEKGLLEEIPQICSMLVSRIQENLKANNGKFRVYRGGHDAEETQKKILLAGHSVVEWAKEKVESSVSLDEGKYIVVSDAYARYSAWATENNYKPSNVRQFGALIAASLLPPGVDSKVVRVGGKVLRVYPHTQWKEEIL